MTKRDLLTLLVAIVQTAEEIGLSEGERMRRMDGLARVGVECLRDEPTQDETRAPGFHRGALVTAIDTAISATNPGVFRSTAEIAQLALDIADALQERATEVVDA